MKDQKPRWKHILGEEIDSKFSTRVNEAVESELERNRRANVEMWRSTWTKVFRDTWLQIAGLCAAGLAGFVLYRRLDDSASPRNLLAHAVLDANREEGDFEVFESLILEELDLAGLTDFDLIQDWDEKEV